MLVLQVGTARPGIGVWAPRWVTLPKEKSVTNEARVDSEGDFLPNGIVDLDDSGTPEPVTEIDYPAPERLIDMQFPDSNHINIPNTPAGDFMKRFHANEEFIYDPSAGAMNYLTHTRGLEFMLALHLISRYIAQPSYKLWTCVTHMCRYLVSHQTGTRILKKVGAKFAFRLTVFIDASYCPKWSPKGKSIMCLLVFLGASLIICEIKATTVVALSSTEAEIIAMAYAFRRIHFAMDFLAELGFKTEVVIYEDNNGVLANLNPIQMNDTVKHIRTKFWYIREASRSCIMRKVHTYWQLADIGTKIHNAATYS